MSLLIRIVTVTIEMMGTGSLKRELMSIFVLLLNIMMKMSMHKNVIIKVSSELAENHHKSQFEAKDKQFGFKDNNNS